MPPMRLIRAGGALVWRFRDPARPIIPGEVLDERDIEVLLVHRPQYHDWSWPKGKIEGKETIPVAAVREVEEETGHVIRLGAPLTTQRYRLGSGQTKEVRYWVGTLMDSDGGKDEGLVHLRKPVHRAPSREIDQTQWMTTSRAHDLLTRHCFLMRARFLLNSGRETRRLGPCRMLACEKPSSLSICSRLTVCAGQWRPRVRGPARPWGRGLHSRESTSRHSRRAPLERIPPPLTRPSLARSLVTVSRGSYVRREACFPEFLTYFGSSRLRVCA